MPKRLTELYQPDDRVELFFADAAGESWRPGRVVGHQPPGVWVKTRDGGLWFVTNGRRIRPRPQS